MKKKFTIMGWMILGLFALGLVMGMFGLIQSEAWATKTIKGANTWLTVMWIGWVFAAAGLVLLLTVKTKA